MNDIKGPLTDSRKGPLRRITTIVGLGAGQAAACYDCWRLHGTRVTAVYLYPVGEHLHYECAACGHTNCLGGDCPPGDYAPTLAGLEQRA